MTIGMVLIAAASGAGGYWLPTIQSLIATGKLPEGTPPKTDKEADAHGHDHAGHDHDHAGHDEASSIELSAQAKKNIGLVLGQITLKPFTKTITVPGMVVDRPGRSLVEVTAPMTGVITRIYLVEGEAVEPGQKLFELRLTHEELVQSQANLLRTAEGLDVIALEIERIEKVTKEGGIAAKTLLERKYEQQKEQAALRAQRQALLLHGLTAAQIDDLLRHRTLLQNLTVTAPTITDDGGLAAAGTLYQVQNLRVAPGQHVEAGTSLAMLADHAELFIRGEAFERDVAAISGLAASGQTLTATLEADSTPSETIRDLSVLYLASRIDPATRTLDFYVTLPNEKQRDSRLDQDHRFIGWRYRPGQRVQLHVPVETLPDRIVLPMDAVAQDGVETYVFTPNGNHFDRRPVHVEYKDQQSVVIANDGSVFPGDNVALRGAKQLQLAIKNKAGGGIDPHAGHNH